MKVVEQSSPIKPGTEVRLSIHQWLGIIGAVFAAGALSASVLYGIRTDVGRAVSIAETTREEFLESNKEVKQEVASIRSDIQSLDDKINFEPLTARMNTMSERLLRIEKKVFVDGGE